MGRLSVVTGVSGSGKSTLAREVLLDNLMQAVSQGKAPGWLRQHRLGAIDRVLEVDQTPIGKTPRSCPATYVGFWDDVRKQFADARGPHAWLDLGALLVQHRRRPLPDLRGPGHAHHRNELPAGREGACDACNGARFNQDTLSVQMRGKNAGELLSMEVDDAIGYFAAHPKIHRPLQLMQDVGLGYLTLGQPRPRCPAARRSASSW